MDEKEELEFKGDDLHLPQPKGRYTAVLGKQVLLNISYFLLATAVCIRGPTFLDLQEVYHTDVEAISWRLIVQAMGGLIGSFVSGYLFGKYPHRHYLLMFIFLVFLGISTAMVPHGGSVPVFYGIILVNGFNILSLQSGHNMLCMNLWRGRNGGPYMHSMHFSFALGALVSPLFAQPFLSHVDRHENETLTLDQEIGPDDHSNIFTLYPILGCLQLAVSIGYLILAILSMRRKAAAAARGVMARPDPPAFVMNKSHKILITLIVVFIMVYVGIEFGNFSYLPVFAVKSDLRLSKAEAVHLMALYLGLYALSRLIGAFLSIKFTPNHILLLDGTLIIIGSLILFLYSQTSFILLHVGFAIQGLGMGTMLANSLLWVQQYMTVTNKMMSVIVVAGSLGVNLAPIIVGQFIDKVPMVLLYLQLGVIVISVVVVGAAIYVGRSIKKVDDREKERRSQEMKEMITK